MTLKQLALIRYGNPYCSCSTASLFSVITGTHEHVTLLYSLSTKTKALHRFYKVRSVCSERYPSVVEGRRSIPFSSHQSVGGALQEHTLAFSLRVSHLAEGRESLAFATGAGGGSAPLLQPVGGEPRGEGALSPQETRARARSEPCSPAGLGRTPWGGGWRCQAVPRPPQQRERGRRRRPRPVRY